MAGGRSAPGGDVGGACEVRGGVPCTPPLGARIACPWCTVGRPCAVGPMAEARVRRSRCSAHVCATSGGCGGAGVGVNARRSPVGEPSRPLLVCALEGALVPGPLRPTAPAVGAVGVPISSDQHQVRQAHTRSQRLAALNTAAQCCRRRVPCTLSMSVTHIKCASLTREASTQLPSAPQPNAAISEPRAMHAQHERDSHGVCQPQMRSQCTTAPSTATQCCRRRVRGALDKRVTHVGCASLTREASAQLPSARQPNAAVAECDARSTRARLASNQPQTRS
jgi:hypothetical protein